MQTDILIEILLFAPILMIFIGSAEAIFFKNKFSSYLIPLIAVLVLTVSLFSSFLLWNEIKQGVIIKYGNSISIQVDWLSGSLLVLFQFLFLLAGLFSIYYIKKDSLSTYFALFSSLQLGLNLVLIASNLFILFMFWELMVISAYGLVIFERSNEALEAGIKYLVMSSVGSLVLLLGIAILSGLVDGLGFEEIQNSPSIAHSLIGKIAIGLIILGFGFTAGIIFLNQWLPDAHPAAPAPISALLSGLVVKAGIYGIYRIMTLLVPFDGFSSSTTQVLLLIGVITMTEGNLMVLAQLQRVDVIDLKRILAYSTTVHLGYLFLVVGINSDLANVAMVYHIINHAIAKALLFLISGYFLRKLNTRDLRNLTGIGRRDKLIGLALFLGFMSLGGLPLTGGFISKLLILFALYENVESSTAFGETLILITLILAVVNSTIAFGGYLWVLKFLVFDEESDEVANMIDKPSDKWVKTLFIIMGLIIIVLGIYPQFIIESLRDIF